MEWPRDLESGGGGFDSRLPEVRSGSLFRHFRDVLGSVWEWSGDILDRCWKVLKKCPMGVRKLQFSKMAGSIFPESGRFRIAFLTNPRSKNIKNLKIQFLP